MLNSTAKIVIGKASEEDTDKFLCCFLVYLADLASAFLGRTNLLPRLDLLFF